MGIDEALYATAVREGRPSLRFYRWNGPWLSLGYGQAWSELPVGAQRQPGLGLVRRVTGGRAVLHGRDLTYCVASPLGRLPGGLLGSFGWVAETLAAGLRRLGIEANCAAHDPTARRGARSGPFDCFSRSGAGELCVGTRKLLGSAQRRDAQALLQHGSLRLEDEPLELRRRCGLDGAHATCLAELGFHGTVEDLQEALIEAFRSRLDAPLVLDCVSETELAQARLRGQDPGPQSIRPDPLGSSQGTPGPADR